LRRLEVQAWPRPLPLGATSKGKHPDENEGHGGDGDDDGGELGPERVITITAECHQFLYHMVRFLAGTLVEVGRGRSPPSGVVEALAAKVRLPGGSVVLAPARGLCLDRCFYDGPAWDESPSSATEAAHAE
jgi:tRNA U38,U39,U40 pseudouridine synthase TruA